MLVMSRAFVPLLLSRTFCTSLVVPTACGAKVKLDGVSARTGAAAKLIFQEGVKIAESGLVGARGRGEIRGTGLARDISVARGIDRYGTANVQVTSAQIGGVDQRLTAAVQLADKRIALAAAESGLQRARGGGKIS